MPQTTKLGLELLQNGAANQILGNATFAQLNQLVQAGVVDKDLATPPGSPANEALYIVAGSPTGAWAGKAGQLAYWLTSTNAWQFIVPREGMLVHVNDEDVYYKYTGSAWSVMTTGMTNPMTTAGDIIIGVGSGVPARLGAGTDGHVLTMVSGAPAWAAGGGGGSGGDMLAALVNSEVSVTGATTLTSAAFGKLHVCSGTTADYTVELPAVAGNAGKFIGVRGVAGLTKTVTLDPDSAETIDGASTLALRATDVIILYCDGTTWTVVGGKQRRASKAAVVQVDTAKAINSGTVTALNFDATSDAEVWASGNPSRITIPSGYTRARFTAQVGFASNATGERYVTLLKNGGPSSFVRSFQARFNANTASNRTDVNVVSAVLTVTPGDYFQIGCYQNSGGALNIDAPNLSWAQVELWP